MDEEVWKSEVERHALLSGVSSLKFIRLLKFDSLMQ